MNKVKNKLVSLFAFAAMAVALIGCGGGGIDPNAVGKWKSNAGMGTIELTSDGKILYGEHEYCHVIQEFAKSAKVEAKCSYKISSNAITLTGTAENKEYKDEYSYTVDGDVLNITIEGKPEGSSFNGKWNRVK